MAAVRVVSKVQQSVELPKVEQGAAMPQAADWSHSPWGAQLSSSARVKPTCTKSAVGIVVNAE